MIPFSDPDLAPLPCTNCRNLTVAVNLSGCIICDEFDDVCGDCLSLHAVLHSGDEVRRAETELLV